ncbi:MAG: hypothetical protein ACJA1B_002501 [Polaribacter sp.]|jgi:hypothetical protein
MVPSVLLILFWFSKKYQYLKYQETKRLELLYVELASEKKIAIRLKNTPKKVQELDRSIQKKLLKIRVNIFNIDFTLSEFF